MVLQQCIEQKLIAAFAPTQLSVENESHLHNVPQGSETHFKVVITSETFAGKSLVARHRAVYQVLAEELAGGVHALALFTFTFNEQGQAAESPNCLGGSKR